MGFPSKVRIIPLDQVARVIGYGKYPIYLFRNVLRLGYRELFLVPSHPRKVDPRYSRFLEKSMQKSTKKWGGNRDQLVIPSSVRFLYVLYSIFHRKG